MSATPPPGTEAAQADMEFIGFGGEEEEEPIGFGNEDLSPVRVGSDAENANSPLLVFGASPARGISSTNSSPVLTGNAEYLARHSDVSPSRAFGSPRNNPDQLDPDYPPDPQDDVPPAMSDLEGPETGGSATPQYYMFRMDILTVLDAKKKGYLTYHDDVTPKMEVAYAKHYRSLQLYFTLARNVGAYTYKLAVHHPAFFELDATGKRTAPVGLDSIEQKYFDDMAKMYARIKVTDITKFVRERKKARGDDAELNAYLDKNFILKTSRAIAALYKHSKRGECELTGIKRKGANTPWKDDGFYYYTNKTLLDHFRRRLQQPIPSGDGTQLPAPGRMLSRSALHVHMLLMVVGNGRVEFDVEDEWKGYKKIHKGLLREMNEAADRDTSLGAIFNPAYTKHAIEMLDETKWNSTKYDKQYLMQSSDLLPTESTKIERAARCDVIRYLIAPALCLMDTLIRTPDTLVLTPIFEATVFNKIREQHGKRRNDDRKIPLGELLTADMGAIVYYWILTAVASNFAGKGIGVVDEFAEKCIEAHPAYFPWAANFVRDTIDNLAVDTSMYRILESSYIREGITGLPMKGTIATKMFYVLFAEKSTTNVQTYTVNTSTFYNGRRGHRPVMQLIQMTAVGAIMDKLQNAPVIIAEPNLGALDQRARMIKAWNDASVPDKIRALGKTATNLSIYSFWMGGGQKDDDSHVVTADPTMQIMGAGFSQLLV